MIITIKRIDTRFAAENKSNLNEYQVEFEAETTCGEAMLHSHADMSSLLPGSQISVETSQSRIGDFQVLSNLGQLHASRLTPLETGNDYEVVGRVSVLYDEVFHVDVEPGSCSFAVGFDGISPTTVVEGDWVMFKVLGLELWDEHF
jgi:hypothetical protein